MLKIHPPYFRFTGEICFSKVQQHSFIRFCIHCYPRMSHKSVHTQLTVCKQSRVAHLLSLIVYPDYTYFPSCSVDEYHRALDKAVYRLVRTYGWIFFDFLFFHFAASHNSKWKVKLTYSTVLLFWKLNSSRHLGGGGRGGLRWPTTVTEKPKTSRLHVLPFQFCWWMSQGTWQSCV